MCTRIKRVFMNYIYCTNFPSWYCNKVILLVFISIETLVSYVMTTVIYRTFRGKLNINFDSDLWNRAEITTERFPIQIPKQFFVIKSSKTMHSLHALGKLVSMLCKCLSTIELLIICVCQYDELMYKDACWLCSWAQWTECL